MAIDADGTPISLHNFRPTPYATALYLEREQKRALLRNNIEHSLTLMVSHLHVQQQHEAHALNSLVKLRTAISNLDRNAISNAFEEFKIHARYTQGNSDIVEPAIKQFKAYVQEIG